MDCGAEKIGHVIVVKLFFQKACIIEPYDATQTTARYCLGVIADSILFSTSTNLMKAGGGRSYRGDFGTLRWENERDKESISVMDGWMDT